MAMIEVAGKDLKPVVVPSYGGKPTLQSVSEDLDKGIFTIKSKTGKNSGSFYTLPLTELDNLIKELQRIRQVVKSPVS